MRRVPMFIAVVSGVVLLMPKGPSAQTPPLHLNPVIERARSAWTRETFPSCRR